MKIFVLLSCCCLLLSLTGQAQAPAEQVAEKIARKMKDSLGLTEQQKELIYGINVTIHNLKAAVWQRYNQRDSVRVHLQMIENRRDSLYRRVLTEEKFGLYRLKKRYLVNNN